MNANDGGPAFPVPATVLPSGQVQPGSDGMSIRVWLAGQAISSVLRDEETVIKIKNQMGVTFTEAAALMAFVVADDMLKVSKR